MRLTVGWTQRVSVKTGAHGVYQLMWPGRRWVSARGRLESDVRPLLVVALVGVVCDALHALTARATSRTLRWPDDQSERACVEGEQGEAAANGHIRVWDGMALSASVCTAMREASEGPIRLPPVLVARLALPVSVLAPYTTNHGSLADDGQANRHTAWHSTLV